MCPEEQPRGRAFASAALSRIPCPPCPSGPSTPALRPRPQIPPPASEWRRRASFCARGGITERCHRSWAPDCGCREASGAPVCIRAQGACGWRRTARMEAPRSALRERERIRTTAGGRRDGHRLPRVSWRRGRATGTRGASDARSSRVAVRGLHLSLLEPERGGSVRKHAGSGTSGPVFWGEPTLL